MRFMKMIFPAVFLGVALVSGLGETAETASPEPSQPSVVTIRIVKDAQNLCDKAYDPPVVTVKAGTTVEWINEDYETHTLVSSEGNDPCRPIEHSPDHRLIDAGQLPPRKEYRQTFTKPGEYPFSCHLPFHQMSGKIIVVP